MVIGLTGATGLIGRSVLRLAHERGHEVVAFTRDLNRAVRGAIETRSFSTDSKPDLTGCEAVVHLAGEPIAGLWTRGKRRRIVQSRVEGTRRVVEAIQGMASKPEVFLSGSAVGFYGDFGEAEITENSPRGAGFLPDTVAAWEAEATKCNDVRTVLLRTAVVLGRKGGALAAMLPAFRLGFGAIMGPGSQWMPWIHLEDEARLILFAIENMDVAGPLNAAAPWPVRQRDFARALGRSIRRPVFLRVPAFALRLVLRGLADELLESKRVLPAAALDYGYGFKYPELEPALRDLLT
jgi:uncharacterized protein (TIGR01777 family)